MDQLRRNAGQQMLEDLQQLLESDDADVNGQNEEGTTLVSVQSDI